MRSGLTTNDRIECDPHASLRNAQSGILGVRTIALSVSDLDTVLEFYQSATGFTLEKQETVSGNTAADELFGVVGVSFRRAVLRSPNMYLELIEFDTNRGAPTSKMVIQGPGMTHTCYQSPATRSGYDQFKKVGADMLTTGNGPVDIGGYGVTYAYGHDPEGNMLEMEQLDEPVLERMGYYGSAVLNETDMWMSQVALVSHDLHRLIAFYTKLLGIKPSRYVEVKSNPKIDAIGGAKDAHILGSWFRLNERSKVLELWQYISPETVRMPVTRTPSSLGYSFSFDVDDIEIEFARLSKLEGVGFFSEPVELGDHFEVFGTDIDGNVFSLRQAVDQTVNPASMLEN